MQQVDVAVIGAGLGGLCAAIRLLQDGVSSLLVLERAAEVGGTWRDNTYPGCACDIPSHLYSYSFEPSKQWTRPYPRQAEIQAYILRVVQKYGLRPYLRLNTTVQALRWMPAEGVWQIEVAGAPALLARTVISATGPLNKPVVPAIEGRDSFEGAQFHSAQWRHDVALEGKRVAIVGTGASAAQIVPELARKVAQLLVFQRTPSWVVARPDQPYGPLRAALYRHLPGWQKLNRWRLYWRNELLGLGFLGSRTVQRLARAVALQYLKRKVPDAALRARLTPSYAPGCKRILVSSDYYRALQAPNVALHTQGIARLAPQGVATTDGRLHACDVVVWCTGFAASEFVTPMRVWGEDGLELSALWRNGPAATHLGLSVAGFPNFFMLVGPSTGLGHNSIVFMIEAQVNYIAQALRTVRRQGKTTWRLLPAVQQASYAAVQEKMRGAVWVTGCYSWYQSPDGRIDTLWPGFTWDYWRRTRTFRADLYEIG